jgi:hypothetical protein
MADWVRDGTLPALRMVYRYLHFQKPVSEECGILDGAIAKLEQDTAWLCMGISK